MVNKKSFLNIYIAITLIATVAFKEYSMIVRLLHIGMYAIFFPRMDRFLKKSFLSYKTWSILLLFYASISIIWAEHQDAAFAYVISLIQVVLLGICLSIYIKTEDDAERVMSYYIVGCVTMAIRTLLSTPVSSWGSGRLVLTTYHVNEMANMCTYAAIMAMAFLFKDITKKRKLVYGIALLLMVFLIILSAAKKNMLCLPVMLVVVFFISQKSMGKFMSNLLLAVIVIWIVLIVASEYMDIFEFAFDRLSNIESLITGSGIIDKSTSEREYLMSTAVEVFKNNPIFGVGINNYRFFNNIGYYAHNNYLELAASLGIIGVIIYYSMYVCIGLNLFLYWKMNSKFHNAAITTLILCLSILDLMQVTYYYEFAHIIIAVISTMCLITRTGYNMESKRHM